MSHKFPPQFCVVAIIGTPSYPPGRYGWTSMRDAGVLDSRYLVNIIDSVPIALLMREGPQRPEPEEMSVILAWAPQRCKSPT